MTIVIHILRFWLAVAWLIPFATAAVLAFLLAIIVHPIIVATKIGKNAFPKLLTKSPVNDFTNG